MREDGQGTGFILGKTPGSQRILLYDDFEGLFKWGCVDGWSCPARKGRVARPFGGAWGSYVQNRRTTTDGWVNLYLGRSFPLAPVSRLRCEAVFLPRSTDQPDAFGLVLAWYDGAKRCTAGFRLAYHGVQPEIRVSGNYWNPFGGTGGELAADAWHHLFLEIDLFRGEYVKAGYDAEVFDLSGVKFYEWPDGSALRANVMFHMGQLAVGIQSVTIDNVLVRTV